jgi:hypothetical protein
MPDVLDSAMVASWVRIEGDDTTLDFLIKAAMHWAEGYCDQPLFQRTYTVALTSFTQSGRLPGLNVAITHVQYSTATLTNEVLATSGYALNSHYGFSFVPASVANLTPTAVTLTYTAGYGADLPENIGLALLLVVSNMYDNRGNPVSEKRTAAENMLTPFKRYSV